MYTYSTMALLAVGASQAATPVCSSAIFDSDGDGWGWENHRSCIVTSTTEITDPSDDAENTPDTPDTPAYKNRHPVCTGANADPDGDGWGWENQRSCYVVADDDQVDEDDDGSDPENTNDDPGSDTNPKDESDPIADNKPQYSKPVCVLPNSDPDGDGWGWENSGSCIVVDAEQENEDASDDDAEGDEPNTPADPEPEKETPDTPVVYSQNFENAQAGLYQSDQLNDAWNKPFWHLGFDQGRVQIASDSTHGQVMQVTFPAGAYGSNGASAFLSDVQFGMELPKTYDELYLSYDIKFADNFDFVLGGKLPGLCGANSESALTEGCNTGGGKPNGFDGWSARSMWRVDGALENYTYHAGQQNFWADSLLWNVRAQRGKWHRVEHRVVLNTVGARDGILEAWLDGTKVLSNTQLEYRKTESVGINLFYFSTFFGGNDPSWAPKTDQILYFDNFVISTEKTE